VRPTTKLAYRSRKQIWTAITKVTHVALTSWNTCANSTIQIRAGNFGVIKYASEDGTDERGRMRDSQFRGLLLKSLRILEIH
jgi:hypothetical protein